MEILIGAFLLGLFLGMMAHTPCEKRQAINEVNELEATHLISIDDGVKWVGVCLPNGIIIAKLDDTVSNLTQT